MAFQKNYSSWQKLYHTTQGCNVLGCVQKLLTLMLYHHRHWSKSLLCAIWLNVGQVLSIFHAVLNTQLVYPTMGITHC